MKTKLFLNVAGLLALAQVANSQGTAFTYQGRLTDKGTPATGNYDLRFAIFDGPSGGGQIGNAITNSPVTVNDGTFIVLLDFGVGTFPGAERWLQIAVRTNGSSGGFTTLSPRQVFAASPYAITAGGVTDANVSLLDVPNTATVAAGTPTVTSGFITGATLTSGGLGYQLDPTVTVNDTTGSGAEIIASVSGGRVVALTVQKPGTGYSPGATLTISPPPNNAFQTFVTPNFFTGVNTITNANNTFAGSFAGDGGGLTNVSAASLDAAAAANLWQLGGNSGTAPGANFLGTTDDQALELKVSRTRALRLEPNTNGAPNVIAGSPMNVVDPGVVGATIGGGGAVSYQTVPATNQVSADFGTIGGGANNRVGAAAIYATVDGGAANAIHAGAAFSTIGGGLANVIQTNAVYSNIGGGDSNFIQTNAQYSTIAGGQNNTVAGAYATIPGGFLNIASGSFSFAAGQMANANHAGAFVWSDGSQPSNFASTAANQFLVRATGGVGIGTNAPAASLHVVGLGQIVSLIDGASTAGTWLSINNRSAGGHGWSLISSGSGNGEGAGRLIFFTSQDNSRKMMLDNVGNLTINGALGASQPQDPLRVAGTGQVVALVDGTSTTGTWLSLTNRSVGGRNWSLISTGSGNGEGAGRLVFFTSQDNTRKMMLDGTGNLTISGTLSQGSDRNTKTTLESVKAQEILEQVTRLPVMTWAYTNEPGVRHIGPMAQDFHATFGLGADEKHIATVDEEGVALAALQGLNQKLEERTARIRELELRLERLERMVNHRSESSK